MGVFRRNRTPLADHVVPLEYVIIPTHRGLEEGPVAEPRRQRLISKKKHLSKPRIRGNDERYNRSIPNWDEGTAVGCERINAGETHNCCPWPFLVVGNPFSLIFTVPPAISPFAPASPFFLFQPQSCSICKSRQMQGLWRRSVGN